MAKQKPGEEGFHQPDDRRVSRIGGSEADEHQPVKNYPDINRGENYVFPRRTVHDFMPPSLVSQYGGEEKSGNQCRDPGGKKRRKQVQAQYRDHRKHAPQQIAEDDEDPAFSVECDVYDESLG